MAKNKFSERKLILFTLGIIILSGIVRLISYSVGVWMFYLSFSPFIFYRLIYYLRNRGKLSKSDKYRRYTMMVIMLTIVLKVLGFQDGEFILLFVLGIDYLIIVQNPRKVNG
ncbi:hypothetical protein [Tenuifilum thalassicum]|uniref:Uncharacterized protein n=1 Tax=Tenuifilum thalassicum TaxID=2590900 RepID=A0A7D3XVX5_9BACT|nr:hypothetical protein [Tenuifilum thalassicum]QKG80208.1 hypothetical protein FHG85_08015 [Tenuifilum thalassicum]